MECAPGGDGLHVSVLGQLELAFKLAEAALAAAARLGGAVSRLGSPALAADGQLSLLLVHADLQATENLVRSACTWPSERCLAEQAGQKRR